MVRRTQRQNEVTGISFPPRGPVRLDEETLHRAHEEGRQFQSEIAKRSAAMFVPSSSEAAKKVR